jgi:ABC-type multidrug transport system permease subunit
MTGIFFTLFLICGIFYQPFILPFISGLFKAFAYWD